MSQTAITLAFEHWKAQQGATGEPVLLDEFVFANVPGLNPDTPVDRNEALPPVEQIVHRQPVTRTGVVNENGVVYSAVLGADVGDFSFNWIGLLNKASGTLAMIVHAPVQQKLKTAEGQQGNVLTRSFLMEYNGAQTETGITTPAETWQIDFTARMAGMDERQRLENADIYGAAAFFGDGWLVAKTGNQFFVTKGTGYVAGLRTSLADNQNITVTTKPVKVWLDVCWTGALTSVWNVQNKITVAENLADYVQNGVQHYVFAVASIDVNGNITDLRPKGTLNEQQASDALKKHEQSRNHPDATTSEKGFTRLSSATDSTSEEQAATPKAVKIAMDNANARLAKERNGADIPNPPLFVQNIGLQDTVNKAAGALQKDQNLNDIPDKAQARNALQLGTAATLDATTSRNDNTLGRVLKVGDRNLGVTVIPASRGFNFNSYEFAAGETLFIEVNAAINFPAGMPEFANTFVYVNVIGIRDSGNDCALLLSRYDTNISYLAWRIHEANTSINWRVLKIPAAAADIGAIPKDPIGTIGNNGRMASADSPGWWLVSLDKPETVADFPKYPNGNRLYSYGFMFVARSGNVWLQQYFSHTGASASRQTWNGDMSERTPWVIDYSTANPPPATDLSAYATQQWVLQNFVQNIDLTAPSEFQFWDGRGYMRPTDGAAMYNFSMVGGSSNVGWIQIRYTRKQVNNTWYVIN
ncbi:phage tail protein [Citrobacter freundii]|uniref:phage tail-collar fiber domain-containing protein n=1 Tax=Citrobacter freundii TaxID=546 RepID=UPI0011E9641D|nr:phage tail protein [Citrobacter freundii]ELK6661448.1 phage tail protein [Citrobacter freundii]ELK7207927.1 phage tail protein [Citrobacter freundii]TYR90513.1 phage tail protein [Citrobacter freundii]HED2322532.1 phage tail protein [Citrobacter freundii]HED3523213.1 phage tail protein [Citrobacter freundii]